MEKLGTVENEQQANRLISTYKLNQMTNDNQYNTTFVKRMVEVIDVYVERINKWAIKIIAELVSFISKGHCVQISYDSGCGKFQYYRLFT